MNGTFFCNKCGAQYAAGAPFCNRCGAPTSPSPGAVPTAVASPQSGRPNFVSSNPAAAYSAPATAYHAGAPVAGIGYGGIWIRLVAAVIDSIILRVVVANA